MCATSGGIIHNIKASEFNEALTESLEQKMIASRITMKIRLHPCLKFRNESTDSISENGTILTRQFGNTDKAVNFTFEYQLKSVRELLDMNLENPIE